MTGPQQPVFSAVWKEMTEAKSLRELDRASSQISRVYNLAHQSELSALYVSLKQQFKPRKGNNVSEN